MTKKAVVELDQQGMIALPESIRRGLPAGTHFLVRRQERAVILLALPQDPAGSFDLSAQAFDFANDLIAEAHEDYVLQAAITNAGQEL